MDIPSSITGLWKRCFDVDEGFVRDFYKSFEHEGNIIAAHIKNDELRISRGIGELGKPVGVVNRVPVQLHLGGELISGSYLYGCCVDEPFRGRGIFRALLDNACSDVPFACLIPEQPELFDMYRSLGFTDCAPCPFPYECSASALDGIELTPCEGNFAPLLALDASKSCDGFTAGGGFEHFALRTLPPDSVYYVYDGDKPAGYIIFENISENIVKIYDMYCPSSENPAIIAIESLLAAARRPKSLIRGCGGDIPALNRFAEY